MNKQQQKNFALIGTIVVIFLLQAICKGLWNTYSYQNLEVPFFVTLIWAIYILVLWIFIGFATNNLKQGLIVAGFHYLFFVTFIYFETPLYLIASLISFGLFGYLVKFNRSQIIQFSIIGTILYLGSTSLRNEFVFWDFVREFIDFELDTINFLNNEFSNTLILIVSNLVMFTLIPVLFLRIKNGKGLNFRELNITETLKTPVATFYFYLFFFAIFSYSYNIVSAVLKSSLFVESSYLDKFNDILLILIRFAFVYLLIWFYRKVVLEYLLKDERTISWNYYFLQVPVLRTIFWIVMSVTKPIKMKVASTRSYRVSSTQNDGILALMVIFFLLKSISLVTSGHFDYGLISVIVSFVSLLLFVLDKNGVFVLFVLQVLFFFLILFLVVKGIITIPRGPINEWMFVIIAYSFMQHPLFHLKAYKIN